MPYNPDLLLQFACHLNVEVCATVKSVKYVIKYLMKSGDMAVFKVADAGATEAQPVKQLEKPRDEISEYLSARYIGPMEAVNTILAFEVSNQL